MCILTSMRRIQIHLDEDVDDELAREAVSRGMSKAALIREYLARHVRTGRPQVSDPTSRLVGVYEGSLDESATVDDVVYDR